MKYKVLQQLSLLEALASLAPDSSKTTLRSWIKEGRVTVDNAIAITGSMVVTPGQIVTVGAKKIFIDGGIQILFEDAHIVVIDKPAKLLSVAAAGESEKTAQNYLRNRYKKVIAVHRLDRGTSGVMLFALSELAERHLNAMFEKHELQRCYTGVIEGELEALSGCWQSYLYEDEQFVVHSSASPGRGALAITHYEVQKSSKKYSLVEFTLETGKKNQIRVHCQEAHHPLVGDKKYGASQGAFKRLCLHAHQLSFCHPITQKKMDFFSPPPEEFHQLLG